MNGTRAYRSFLFFIGLLIMATLLASAPARTTAAPSTAWIVNSVDDTDDGSCDSKDCTLREAVNLSTSGDSINFASSIAGSTIILTSELTIDKDLVIVNKNLISTITISGSDTTRLFYVNYNKSLTLRNLILVDGLGSSSGGAVYNDTGNVTIEKCQFESNNTTAAGSGGALYNDNDGAMDVHRSTFTNNTGKRGGAIWNYGSLTVTDSTFENNSAEERGGGIYNNLNADGLTIENSTFTGNTTTDYGGGAIYNEAQAQATITNSTFYGNSAGGSGGGIYSYSLTYNVITNSTFFDNGGSISGEGGGLHIMGTLFIYNTIIANSTGGYDCWWNYIDSPISIRNLITNNAPSPNSCGTPYLTSGPMLQSLADNGGYTETMALMSASPAINAGHAVHCPDVDQRSLARPQGSGCDIGAYEYDYPPEVLSSKTADPNPTSEGEVHFTVMFNEPVTGVDIDDFDLTTDGINGAEITGASGADDIYSVTVDTGRGTGTICLDVIDNDTINDSGSNPLGGPGPGNGDFDSGECYFMRYSHVYLPLVIK
jgi:CSLREA domain-containing protein